MRSSATAPNAGASTAFSIADFATLPWVYRHTWQELDLADFPNVKRWYETLMARPALARGMELPA